MQAQQHLYLLFLLQALGIQGLEQRLAGSESGLCVLVERHMYP